MTKQQSINKMLALSRRLDKIVTELYARKEEVLARTYHKVA
ncbi:hypothetical protein [Xenorhabdus griffiniae]|uniref:Uncharacterized protein n=1 Tax=Xenorhabdus griffiniae TaxID=351672 RepID=A0ABY9XL21_9GAMM|nr:hypothetical protein [Xenorhabdus griffiniae]WMV71647.1 hypothetical protein QL128_16115 [Xenorhabdus griffiniae]WMV73560.1 hypothetical protein QL128_05930 [Xenorhabdus griffiniae]WNH01324.1 hypothetical protein QL112_016120 [Xenorhabdus griffiniae]WNH03240.1 hypothetical protein QL112_005935 [Xenorhabdus griffiniae]